MSDLRDFTGKNRKFTGTSGIKLPTGTQAQRVDETARIRFNTDTNLAEYYDGTAWKPIDSPPTISSVSPTSWSSDGSTRQTFTVSGSNFQSGATAKFVGNDGTEYTSVNLNIVSSSTFTLQNTTDMLVAKEPYDIIITNPSGLAATIEDAVDAGSSPSFATAADTNLGTVSQGQTDPTLTTAAATDADGQTVTHTVTSGSLPPGLSMATNGTISGTVGTISTNTNYTFTVTATDSANTATRQFVISGTPPAFMVATGGTITTDGDYKVHTFTSSGTFTVTTLGVDSTYGSKVEYLVVAGGGGGGGQGHGGAGGAGGYRHNSAYNFTVSAQAYSITVGSYANNKGGNGGNSTFSNITSAGGGQGGHNDSEGGRNGGSGGGGSGHFNSGGGGSGNTPSVSPSQGNNGGSGQDGTPHYGAGGGGGASNAGQNGSRNSPGGGIGGNGSSNDIHGSSRTYSAGGGGHGHGNPAAGGSSGLGGAANAGSGGRNTANNYGMGGGGDNNNASSGVVIIRYKFQ